MIGSLLGLGTKLPDIAEMAKVAKQGMEEFEALKRDVAEIKLNTYLIMAALNIPQDVIEVTDNE